MPRGVYKRKTAAKKAAPKKKPVRTARTKFELPKRRRKTAVAEIPTVSASSIRSSLGPAPAVVAAPQPQLVHATCKGDQLLDSTEVFFCVVDVDGESINNGAYTVIETALREANSAAEQRMDDNGDDSCELFVCQVVAKVEFSKAPKSVVSVLGASPV